MSRREQKKASHNRRAFLAYSLLTLVVAAIAIGGISAKYFKVLDQENGTVSAKNFYFESDQLGELNPEYQLAAGTRQVTFNLRNHVDSLNWSDDPIHYTVTVNGEGATLRGPVENVLPSVANATAEFTLDGLQDGETYVVTATSGKEENGKKTGYVKTLQATFKVDTDNGAYMSLSTSGPQVILTLWTKNVTGAASFTIPRGLIPNVTESPELSGVTNYRAQAEDGYHYAAVGFTGSVAFDAYTSKAYYFIKEKPEDTYTLSDFYNEQDENLKITIGTVKAEAALP